MKILVIDDNPAFRYSLAGALGKGGYHVVMATTASTGSPYVARKTPIW